MLPHRIHVSAGACWMALAPARIVDYRRSKEEVVEGIRKEAEEKARVAAEAERIRLLEEEERRRKEEEAELRRRREEEERKREEERILKEEQRKRREEVCLVCLCCELPRQECSNSLFPSKNRRRDFVAKRKSDACKKLLPRRSAYARLLKPLPVPQLRYFARCV